MDEHPYGQLEKIKVNCSDSLRINHFTNVSLYQYFDICILKHRFAAAESNLSVMFYLISQDHDTYGLLDDKRVSNGFWIRLIIVPTYKPF